MKKLLFLLMIPAAITFASCGTDKIEETPKIPGMMEVDLTQYGMQVTMMIPDSTKGAAEIVQESWGVDIKVGKSFQMMIRRDAEDAGIKKSDIQGNEINKLKRFVKEEPNLLFYETSLPDAEQSQFHFWSVMKVGEDSYTIEDNPMESFSEKDVERMIESVKSMKDKKKPEA